MSMANIPEGGSPRGYSEQYASAAWGCHTFPDGTMVIFDGYGTSGGGPCYMVFTKGSTAFVTIPIRSSSGGQFVWSSGGYTWYSSPRTSGGGYWVKQTKPVNIVPLRANKR